MKSCQKSFSILVVLAVILAVIASAIMPGSALAAASGPGNGPNKSNLTNQITPPCTPEAFQTWLDIYGSLIVNIVGYSGFYTPPAQLDFGGGKTALAFCTDISHGAEGGRNYCLDSEFFSDWRVAWLVNHYPPLAGSANRLEHAARQAAVWFFTDSAQVNRTDPTGDDATTDAAFLARYDAIIASIPTNPPAEYAGEVKFVIDPATKTNFLPGEEVHPFTVRLTEGGQALSGYPVTVSADFGTLNKTNAVTDQNGEAVFTLTSNLAGNATITANTTVTLTSGSRFTDENDPLGRQRLVLGESKTVPITATAKKTWVSADNLVIAHKFEDKNYDGMQESNEPDLANWEFTLNTPVGVYTSTTDSKGNAYFYDKVTDNGSYTLAETLKDAWTNSTSLSQSRTRSDADAWTRWEADFGNAQYSVITVYKFEDKNGNGTWDAGEPPLENWHFELKKWEFDEGTWVFATYSGGNTGSDGSLSFTDLEAGKYQVIEQDDPNYDHITDPVLVIDSLGSREHVTYYFGNQRKNMDYGDLPEGTPFNYAMTTFADNGARHITGDLWLGAQVNQEYDGQPDPQAGKTGLGDQFDDGVVVVGNWVTGTAKVNVTVLNGKKGCLMGWMDYWNVTSNTDGPDGVFTPSFVDPVDGKTYSETVINNRYIDGTSDVYSMTFDIPADIVAAQTFFARFRLAPYDDSQGTTTADDGAKFCQQAPLGLTGLAINGEVEDYAWSFSDTTAVTLQSFQATAPLSSEAAWPLVSLVGVGSLGLAWITRRKEE